MGPVEAPAVFEVAAGAATDPGRLRRHNEDAHLVGRPVFLVADGMGGHERGEVASAEAVRQFATLVGRPWVTPQDVQERVASAASAIAALAVGGRAPGSTVAGVALSQESGRPYWLAFNLGDSRVYLLRSGRLEQVTVDHSRHQELLDAGIDPATADVGRNVITRALGGGTRGAPALDVWLRPALTGDRVLVCSDGLSTELTELLILAILRSVADPADAAAALVAAALDAAGRDNVTAVVVDALRAAAGGAPDDLEDDTATEREEPDTETERDAPGLDTGPPRTSNCGQQKEGSSRVGAVDAGN